jgi:polyhydroxyalkanoate synthesis regulator phasin
MPEDDGWQRYVDAASALAQLARARVEEIARELRASGATEGEQARQRADDLLERSRSVVDEVVDVVRTEVTRQLETLGLGSPEELFRRLSETFGRSGSADRSPPPRPVVPIEAAAAAPGTEKSASTPSASKQRTAKPKGADKKKQPKKASASKKGAPHAATKAAQKSATAEKKRAAPKSAGRGT